MRVVTSLLAGVLLTGVLALAPTNSFARGGGGGGGGHFGGGGGHVGGFHGEGSRGMVHGFHGSIAQGRRGFEAWRWVASLVPRVLRIFQSI